MTAESQANREADVETAEPEAPRKHADPRAESKNRRQPPYAVILHNDHLNSMDFVIESLIAVFGYSSTKCFMLTLQAHAGGRSLIWSGMKEHAEFKAEQLKSRGADPEAKASGAKPLKVTIEPMPQ